MRVFLPFIILAIVISGCASRKAVVASKEEPVVKYVESPDLAKIILKAPAKQFAIHNDPFKPILTKDEFGQDLPVVAQTNSADGVVGSGANTLGDVAFLGVVRVGEEYRAFLKTPIKTGVFKEQDKIGNYTVQHIDINKIVLHSENNDIVRKRGQS